VEGGGRTGKAASSIAASARRRAAPGRTFGNSVALISLHSGYPAQGDPGRVELLSPFRVSRTRDLNECIVVLGKDRFGSHCEDPRPLRHVRLAADSKSARAPDRVCGDVIPAPKSEPRIIRYEPTDCEWSVIKPMLPNKPRGVSRVDDRRVLNNIFWMLRSGAPWRDLPESYGPVPLATIGSFAGGGLASGTR